MLAHDAILRLADRDMDRYDFAREGARVLRRAVPFDAIAGVWFDPETGLRVDAFRQLAASGRPAASMSEATGGTLDRSRRRPGLGDELRSVYFSDSGTGPAN